MMKKTSSTKIFIIEYKIRGKSYSFEIETNDWKKAIKSFIDNLTEIPDFYSLKGKIKEIQ